jgi:hypothetical protein
MTNTLASLSDPLAGAPSGWQFQLSDHQRHSFFELFVARGNAVMLSATNVWAAAARAWTYVDDDAFRTGPSTLDSEATVRFRRVMESPVTSLPAHPADLSTFPDL